MKSIKIIHIYFAAAVLALSALACGELSVGIETPDGEQTSIEDSVSATLTSQAPTETVEPTAVPLSWMDSAAQADYSLPAELAGLVYRQGDNIWLAADDSNPLVVAADVFYAQLSPDLTKLVYVDSIYEEENLVLLDLNTGERKNLTDTPTVMEGGMQWWPSNPDIMVFNQTPQDESGMWAGFLGAIDLKTGEHFDLDMQSRSVSGFALSPDGRTILYDDSGAPVLYLWGEGISRLDMAGYGVNYEFYRAPAWSPDGKMAAFYATRTATDGGATEAAIVLVNFETGQAREMHPNRTIGQRGGPEIAFSPDGRWLAVVNPGEESVVNGGPMALWVMAVDGSEEHYLGYGTGPMWNPAGDTLLYTMWPLPGQSDGSFQSDAHITMIHTGEWTPQEIVPLLGSTLLSWYELP